MISRFLPTDWADKDSLVLLAGQGGTGSYPYDLVKNALVKGVKLKLLALKEETSDEVAGLFEEKQIRRVTVGDLGGLLKALRELNAKGLIMAGQVTPGRLFKEVFPDLRAVALIAGLKEKNAETIFGAVSAEIEKEGVKVLDARTFMDDEMADKGEMTRGGEKVKEEAIAHAIKIAEECARLDIGQCAVTRKGTVLAVEAFEGTNAMIERSAGFKTDEKIFVKTVKNHQDYRFDVPIFGGKTLEKIIEAGIKTVVLKADGVIIPQKKDVLKLAQKQAITIIGR